jgi:hypothetical protein
MVPGEKVPIRKPGSGAGIYLGVAYLVFLVLIFIFAALWLKILFSYFALLFLSVALIKGYVQLVDRGLVVFAITRFTVPYEQIKSVTVGPPREPMPDFASLEVRLKYPKKALMSYALPIPVPISEVRVDVPKVDAEALSKSIAALITTNAMDKAAGRSKRG